MMKREQTDIGRFYVTDRAAMPSVTTILGIVSMPWISEWRGRVGNDYANSQLRIAGLFGTEIHNIIEDINLGKKPVINELHRKHVIQYLKWHKEHVKSVIALEQFVYDEELGYAGTLDMIAELRDGSVAMIDFKTSNNMMKTYYLQLAAYREAYRRMHGLELTKSVVVKISRSDAEMSVYESQNHDKDFAAFQSAIQLFNWFYAEEIAKIQSNLQ